MIKNGAFWGCQVFQDCVLQGIFFYYDTYYVFIIIRITYRNNVYNKMYNMYNNNMYIIIIRSCLVQLRTAGVPPGAN